MPEEEDEWADFKLPAAFAQESTENVDTLHLVYPAAFTEVKWHWAGGHFTVFCPTDRHGEHVLPGDGLQALYSDEYWRNQKDSPGPVCN